MHTVGARLRARASLSSTGERVSVRRRCFSVLEDRPSAQSLPPRPRRRNLSDCIGAATNATNAIRRSSTYENPRAAVVTDADFPRVLNGPAPGFAEDALRRLLIDSLPGEGGSSTEIGYGELASGRAPVDAAAWEGGGGGDGAVFPRVFHDAGVSSSVPSLLSSLSSEPSRSGGAHGNALDAGGDAAAARHLEASRRTLGWRTGGGRRAGGVSGAERLHGGASLLQEGEEEEEEEEEEVSSDERQQRQHVDGHLNGHVNGYRDGRNNGYTNDRFSDQASQRRPRQAFSSAADVAENDDWEALMLDQETEREGSQGTDKEPLSYSTLWGMQLAREEQSHQEACDKYSKMLKNIMTMGKGSQMKPIERLLTSWYPGLKARIEAEQAAVWENPADENKKNVRIKGAFGGRNTYGPLLVMLKAEKQAVLVMHEVVNLILADGNKGVSTVKACRCVAELVQAEVNLMNMKKEKKAKPPSPVSSRRHVREVNKKAQAALDMLEHTPWPIGAQVKLGAALIKFLIETATWVHDESLGGVSALETGEGKGGRASAGVPRAAFVHEVVRCKNKQQQGTLSLAPEIYAKMVDEDISRLAAPRYVPMLVPPRDWTQPDRGGFLRLHSQIMRTRGEAAQKHALRRADLTRVYQGLNCLGKVRWRINETVLDTVLTCLNDKIAVGDLPVGKDLPLPPVPEGVEVDERGKLVPLPKKVGDESEEEEKARKKRRQKYYGYKRMVDKIKTKNANMHSLRCDMQIKVGIAEEFRDYVIYFPYNMDFRGRTYPIPPNLNILGSDFSRGVLVFDEARPLGERGLYWLKVHLANLFGEDKVSFDDRVSFVEESLDKIRDSALRPLDGDRWWMEADNPWQCLAVCKDLTAALDSPDPSQYLSCLPVHQDGSCNGLQHYAALGLDAKGGAQVNLVPSTKPQDVYTGVCDVVKKKVELEASTAPGPDASEAERQQHRMANLVRGLVDRKVVKQTVMTSVYGVTFVGARKQIQNVLEEKIIKGTGVPSAEAEADVYRASAYVAKLTMNVLEELFTEARNIMEWLMAVSKLVAKEGQPMTWITPLGLPVLQPYRRKEKYQVQTLLQGVHIREDADNLPIAVKRQTSAFPPNFVHSLDSTHMLLTAIEMDEAGVPFAAVHDSYWVHAGHVDQMNRQLRQCFVDLYSGPILEELHDSIRMRYPTIEFPPIPARGSLKLEDVKDSEYFFN